MVFLFLLDRLIDNVNFEEVNNGLSISWKTSAYDKACYELFKVDMCALDHDAPCRTTHATSKVNIILLCSSEKYNEFLRLKNAPPECLASLKKNLLSSWPVQI